MTVDDIKDYIDEHYDDDEECNTTTELRTLYGETLDKIKSMLDELDRPNEVKLMCPRCKDERQKPITEFCGKCGETMEVIEIYYTKGEKAKRRITNDSTRNKKSYNREKWKI